MITQGKLKNLLSYNPDSGEFYWNESKNNQLKAGDKAGWINGEGYINIEIEGMCYKSHRLAWLYMYGYTPKIIDHINRIRNDNRIINLRECDFSENARNRKIQINNKSGRVLNS
ncbi:HNH endonuclease signature motif containing protein [Xenorhabdus bovienii]|uniref:Similar to T5p118 from Bacteriophage T5 n=1 Tax=Xenorhabdus bovienii str. Intermedium TaxID=1379677 RepID=A0A077QPB8_XENBV